MMNKHHIIYFTTLFIIFSMIFSCQSVKTPLQVSEHFWLGIKTKNTALVKKYSLADSIDTSEDLSQIEKIESVTFDKIIIDGNTAEVETNVTILSDEKSVNISLNTVLENKDAWKVNYRKTVQRLKNEQNVSEIFADIEEMTEEITKDIEESVEEIKEKVVPEIELKVEQAEKELLEKLPELKNIFDEFLQELEKSLEELLPPEEEVETQET